MAFCTEQFYRGAAPWAIIAPEKEQMQRCGEIITQQGKVMRCSVAIVVAEAEDTHVADRTGGTARNEHVHQTWNDEDNCRKCFKRQSRHVIRCQQYWKYNNAGNRDKQEQREECGHDSREPVSASYRTMHKNLALLVGVDGLRSPRMPA